MLLLGWWGSKGRWLWKLRQKVLEPGVTTIVRVDRGLPSLAPATLASILLPLFSFLLCLLEFLNFFRRRLLRSRLLRNLKLYMTARPLNTSATAGNLPQSISQHLGYLGRSLNLEPLNFVHFLTAERLLLLQSVYL